MSASDLHTNSTNLSSSVGDLAQTHANQANKMPKSTKYEILRSLNDIRTVRDLSSDAVRDILRHHTRDGGLEITKMNSLEDMSGCNDAFNSSIVSLTIQARYAKSRSDGGDGSDVEEEFHFVIKSPPKSHFIRLMHKFTRPFFNEVSWYLDLVSQVDLANGKNCLKSSLPLCYHAYSQYYASEPPTPRFCELNCPWFCFVPCRASDEGVLILENIKHREGKTYRMFNKHKPLDEPHVKMIMKALGHFHGKWIKYKFMSQAGQLKKVNDSDPEPTSWGAFEHRYSTQKRMPKLVYTQLKNVAKRTILLVLKKEAETEEADKAEVTELSERCNRFFDQTAPRILSEYLSRDPTPIHTLCHGDFWSNNIMFSYKDDQLIDEDEPIIIDYQLVNFGHPCYDLVYFLYLNTDLSFRDRCLRSMLEIYHQTLSLYLEPEASYLPDKFRYSFDEFLSDFRWHMCIGFVTALAVMPNVLSDAQVNIEGNALTAFRELQRKQKEELMSDDLPHSKETRRRLIDLVREMAREKVI